jgi:hypothetical protein
MLVKLAKRAAVLKCTFARSEESVPRRFRATADEGAVDLEAS